MFLPIEAALMTLSGTALFFSGMMMGVSKTKSPLFCNITGMRCVRIVGAMICIRFLKMGFFSAWACMIAHNMLLCLYLGTFVRGGWNPLNVEGS